MKNRRAFIARTWLPFVGRASRLTPIPATVSGVLALLTPGRVRSAIPEGGLPTLRVSASLPGTYDYTVGQVFKKGAVPAGTKLRTTAERSQVDWLQTWSDGSLLQAAVTIRESLSAKPKTVGFEFDDTKVASGLTLADLLDANPQAVVTFSGNVAAQVRLSDLLRRTNDGTWRVPGLVKQRISGPLMSEWKFYSPVRDTHLSVGHCPSVCRWRALGSDDGREWLAQGAGAHELYLHRDGGGRHADEVDWPDRATASRPAGRLRIGPELNPTLSRFTTSNTCGPRDSYQITRGRCRTEMSLTIETPAAEGSVWSRSRSHASRWGAPTIRSPAWGPVVSPSGLA